MFEEKNHLIIWLKNAVKM